MRLKQEVSARNLWCNLRPNGCKGRKDPEIQLEADGDACLEKRGIRLGEDGLPVNRRKPKKVSPLDILKPQPQASSPAQTEWDAWFRKFQSLLG